ncbi:hypothetical protein BD779DRAFT_1670717 [Infundibulicybe gibba]|nr:hypothetical protein BD779DRAFT_1670717 [Infundibulicybe gibba]
MASLLERMNIPASSSAGPVRSRAGQPSNRPSIPYNRANRIPKGDVDSPWSHDLYESGTLSSRLSDKPTAPKAKINSIAQKALRDATSSLHSEPLSIKGASSPSNGNVVEVTGLVSGTTAEDVVAIFKRCGTISNAKLVPGGDEVTIRVTFKTPASAASAVQKFHNQPADGKILSVRIVGSTSAGTTLGGRLGGPDGLGLVREEGSVDILMGAESTGGSKMRSDSLIHADPRAQILLAPPGANPADYISAPTGPRNSTGGRHGVTSGRGRNPRRGPRRGGNGGGESGNMDID